MSALAILSSKMKPQTGTTGATQQGAVAMGNASLVGGYKSCLSAKPPQKKFSDAEICAEFSAVVHPFSRDQLRRAAGRSAEAAKHWVRGTRAPNLASTLNMARSIPVVQQWLMEMAGAGDRAAQSGSADAVLQIVRTIALGEGPDAAMCRAILRQAESEQKERATDNPLVRDAWKLHDLREERARQEEERKSAAVGDFFDLRRRA